MSLFPEFFILMKKSLTAQFFIAKFPVNSYKLMKIWDTKIDNFYKQNNVHVHHGASASPLTYISLHKIQLANLESHIFPIFATEIYATLPIYETGHDQLISTKNFD